tara:strand:+ start:44 stop:415 length:372 start_codon:yes stop_codon:yes gene_type:complete
LKLIEDVIASEPASEIVHAEKALFESGLPRFGIQSKIASSGKSPGHGKVSETIITLVGSEVLPNSLTGGIHLKIVVQGASSGSGQIVLKRVLSVHGCDAENRGSDPHEEDKTRDGAAKGREML